MCHPSHSRPRKATTLRWDAVVLLVVSWLLNAPAHVFWHSTQPEPPVPQHADASESISINTKDDEKGRDLVIVWEAAAGFVTRPTADPGKQRCAGKQLFFLLLVGC